MADRSDDELAALFQAHYGRLVGMLTAATGDREVAADCVQEAFVQAHLHWRKVRAYGDPVGWVRRVAINRARDHFRRLERRQRAIDRLRARPSDTGSPEQPVDLVAALAVLPRQQRMAVALHYLEGMTVAEVAGAMRLSEGAVKYHLHEGRDRLRRVITPLLEEDR